jgi:hypothetical protein
LPTLPGIQVQDPNDPRKRDVQRYMAFISRPPEAITLNAFLMGNPDVAVILK